MASVPSCFYKRDDSGNELPESERDDNMGHFYGILIGLLSFVSIGLWHPIVIKGEYYFGKKICAPVFAIVGVICICLSLLFENQIASVGFAVFGFSALWGVKEVFDQEKRVQKGWFPKRGPKKGKK